MDNLISLIEKFKELKDQLKPGQFIEYSIPGDRLSAFLRVRLIECFGTLKYCIKSVDSLGREGSGDYHDLDSGVALLNALSQQLIRIHRPTGLLERLPIEARTQLRERAKLYCFTLRDDPRPPQPGTLTVEVAHDLKTHEDFVAWIGDRNGK